MDVDIYVIWFQLIKKEIINYGASKLLKRMYRNIVKKKKKIQACWSPISKVEQDSNNIGELFVISKGTGETRARLKLQATMSIVFCQPDCNFFFFKHCGQPNLTACITPYNIMRTNNQNVEPATILYVAC